MPDTPIDRTDAEVRALAEENLRLIDFVIRRYGYDRRDGYNRDDAWQDGYFGLEEAIRRWDPRRGELSTIATIYIIKAIRKGRGTYGGINYRRETRGSSSVPRLPVSLDRSSGYEDSVIEVRVISDGTELDPESQAERSVLIELVKSVGPAMCCNDVDRAVLASLIDFDDHRSVAAKHRDIGDRFGLSSETVRQRQHALIERIREAVGGQREEQAA